MTPVAKDLVADLAGARRVDQHAPGRRLVGDPRARAVELDDVAVLCHQHLQRRLDAAQHPLGHPRMLRQLAILAVHRHEVPRAHERQHELQFLRAAMAGDVHVLHRIRHHVGAAPRDVAHHTRDRLLVPGNRARREHHRIVRPELHVHRSEPGIGRGHDRADVARLAGRAVGADFAQDDLLLERHGIYIQPINYPTVPRGTERLRITPTPAHDVRLIRQLADAMVSVWQELDLPLGKGYQPAGQLAQTVAAGG